MENIIVHYNTEDLNLKKDINGVYSHLGNYVMVKILMMSFIQSGGYMVL